MSPAGSYGPAPGGARRWYAVHSRPHGERRAFENLRRQGYQAWLPLYRKKRRHAGRVETVLRPLFPRYLFVAVDLDSEPWRAILSTYGVADMVGVDGPQPVPEPVIERLMAEADADGYFTLHQSAKLRPGDRVRVVDGPFGQLEGVFEARTDAERVVILLTLLGRQVAVTVPANDIEPP